MMHSRVAQDGAATGLLMVDMGISHRGPVSRASAVLVEMNLSPRQMGWLTGAGAAVAVLGVLAGISLIGRLVGVG